MDFEKTRKEGYLWVCKRCVDFEKKAIFMVVVGVWRIVWTEKKTIFIVVVGV